MPTRLARLEIKRVAMVDAGDNPEAAILLYKRKGGAADAAMDSPLEEERKMAEDQATIQELQDKLTAAEAAKVEAEEARVALETQVAELTKRVEELTPPEPEPDPMDKVAPEVKARLEELEKKNKEAEAKVAKMQDEKATEEAQAVVKTLAYLPGVTVENTAPLVKALRLKDADLAKQVEKVLADANAALKESKALEAAGADGASDLSDIEKRVKAEAAELIKSDSTLTPAQAEKRVWTAHPDWYADHTRKQREG